MIQNWIIFDGSEHYSDIPCGSEIPNAGTQPGTHDQYAPGTGSRQQVRTGGSHLVRNHHCARTVAPVPTFRDKLVKPLDDIQASPLSRVVVSEGFH